MIIMMIMKQQAMIHDDDHDDDDADDEEEEEVEEEEEECVFLVHFHQTTWAVHGCVLPLENNAVLPCIYDKEHVVQQKFATP